MQKIYELCLAGRGPSQIARQLENERVLVPSAYYESVDRKHSQKVPLNPYNWDQATVVSILENKQYTSCAVNFKSTTVSYKVHKVIHNPVEQQQIIPNMQEPIVSEEVWLRVQELRSNRRRNTAMGNYAGLTSSVENNVITVLVESVNNNSTSGISNFTATGTLLNIVFTSAYTKDSSFPVEFTKVDRQSVVNDTVQDITNSLSYCDGAVVCTTYVPTTAVAKPAKPVIKSVAYSAKNQIKITWNKASGATSYDVYRGSKKIKTVTGTSYKDTVKTAGTVKYIVAAKNAGGTTKSAEKSIKTMSFSAKATVKGTPAKKAVTVKITKKVKNAGGYEYSISLKKNMKSAKTKKTNKASFKFTKLKSKKVYYVRVRAYKKVGSKYIWGAYSKTVKVKKTK